MKDFWGGFEKTASSRYSKHLAQKMFGAGATAKSATKPIRTAISSIKELFPSAIEPTYKAHFIKGLLSTAESDGKALSIGYPTIGKFIHETRKARASFNRYTEPTKYQAARNALINKNSRLEKKFNRQTKAPLENKVSARRKNRLEYLHKSVDDLIKARAGALKRKDKKLYAYLSTTIYNKKKGLTKISSFLERFFYKKEKEVERPQWGVKLNLAGDVGDNAQDQGGMFTTSPSAGSDVYTGRSHT